MTNGDEQSCRMAAAYRVGGDRHLDGRQWRVAGQFIERLWRAIKYEEVYTTPTKPCPKP
ncbi:hypothetical protein SM11_pC1271 (plasmid) [Sinorhizobium meliloti SM11]|uniref:Uncharacterized protein n=1 Tax=Sinorhizobium meliloti (strain SM11) TaxID=707241 RepID=F7XFM4_SINMM|nr:hypothetical protein SM11_pC1271 [Sinorhizobium meliloti SM11]